MKRLGLALALLVGCQAPPSAAPADPVDAETAELYARLLTRPTRVDPALMDRLVRDGRRDLVPALVELLRFEPRSDAIASALERLTGQPFADDWPAWVAWLVGSDIVPAPGFDGWKADLLASIDPAFRLFLHAGVPTRIRLEEIVWGGVRKDGIPALVDPRFVEARAASYLTDDELVFGVEIAGDARAYPHRILDWHEMADDVVGGVPIALVY